MSRYLLAFKKLKRVLASIRNSKTNGSVLLFKAIYLGIEIVSCCLMQRMARIDMDWDVKGGNAGMLCLQNHQKYIMVSAPRWNLFDIFSVLLYRSILSMGIKALSYDFSTELT